MLKKIILAAALLAIFLTVTLLRKPFLSEGEKAGNATGEKEKSRISSRRSEASICITENCPPVPGGSRGERMDRHFEKKRERIGGADIREIVWKIFGIDINYVSRMNYGSTFSCCTEEILEKVRISMGLDPRDTKRDQEIKNLTKNQLMDRVIEAGSGQLKGPEARRIINQIYGINLDGISRLENSRLGIFSKGQWIIQSSQDIFIIASSPNDVELYVSAGPAFKQVYGTQKIPETLSRELERLKFEYNEAEGKYKWKNPTEESAPDVFKTEAISYILKEIERTKGG